MLERITGGGFGTLRGRSKIYSKAFWGCICGPPGKCFYRSSYYINMEDAKYAEKLEERR